MTKILQTVYNFSVIYLINILYASNLPIWWASISETALFWSAVMYAFANAVIWFMYSVTLNWVECYRVTKYSQKLISFCGSYSNLNINYKTMLILAWLYCQCQMPANLNIGIIRDYFRNTVRFVMYIDYYNQYITLPFSCRKAGTVGRGTARHCHFQLRNNAQLTLRILRHIL